MKYDIKDITLANKGRIRTEWAIDSMPVLNEIKKQFIKNKPLKNIKIAACLHITTETAFLVSTLKAADAQITLCASNPLSTQDDVAAYLVRELKIPVFGIKGENKELFYQHLNNVLDYNPQIIIDDGADLISYIHSKRRNLIKNIIGGTEETTTGVTRLHAMAKSNILEYPVFAINDTSTKHLFDNRYGTGQSTISGILKATNRLIAGSTFVVCGYGWCGRGIAMRAKGMGANVFITEINPLRALEAVMDGYQVMPIAQAAPLGDFFCTATGNIHVIREEHFIEMKDGVIICNSGHFNIEINLEDLTKISPQKKEINQYIDEYTLINNRRIYILCKGRLVNLIAAQGHPSSIMDMSFANQALCSVYIKNNNSKLINQVYSVPKEIDIKVAQMKLSSMKIFIDKLTIEQKKYYNSWNLGT